MIQPLSPTPQGSPPPSPDRKLHWPSILAAVGGGLAFIIFLSGAGLFLFSGILALISPQSAEAGEAGLMFSYMAASFLLSLLALPPVLLAVRRLSNGSSALGFLTVRLSRRQASLLVMIYLLVLVGGMLFSNLPQIDWLTMPILTVLGLSLPVILLLWLGTRNLPDSSSQRNWTVFNLSYTLSPLLILIIELLAIFSGIILLSIMLVFFIPDLSAQIEEFALMMETAQQTMQFPEEELYDLLQSPLVVAVLLGFASGIVPLVEESIKPLGVWLPAGRSLTPRDGWVLGLLSGAGFALIENLGNLAIGQEWAALTLARGGATALHMFNSAIIGYTFVLSRQQKRWHKVIIAFLGTLLLHSLWNTTAVLAMVASLQDPSAAGYGWPIGYLLVLGLATAGTIWGIYRVNTKLAGASSAAAETDLYIESEIQDND